MSKTTNLRHCSSIRLTNRSPASFGHLDFGYLVIHNSQVSMDRDRICHSLLLSWSPKHHGEASNDRLFCHRGFS